MENRKVTTIVAAAFVILIVIIIFAAVYLKSDKGEPGGEIDGPRSPEVSALAPDFTLVSLNGDSVTLSGFVNRKAVLLTFGQTICPACEAEVDALKQIHRKYGAQVEVISVFIAESERKVSKFADDKKITYTVLLDMDQAVARRYFILGIPLNLIIDKNGRIVFKEHFLPHNIERYLNS